MVRIYVAERAKPTGRLFELTYTGRGWEIDTVGTGLYEMRLIAIGPGKNDGINRDHWCQVLTNDNKEGDVGEKSKNLFSDLFQYGWIELTKELLLGNLGSNRLITQLPSKKKGTLP